MTIACAEKQSQNNILELNMINNSVLNENNNNVDKKEITDNQPSSAVRPHHRMKPITSGRGKLFKVRNMMNLSFMLLTVIGIAVYYSLPNARQAAIVIVLLAVILKIAEVFIRIFHK